MIALRDRFNQVHNDTDDKLVRNIYKHLPEINDIDNRGFPICRPLFTHSSLPEVLDVEEVGKGDFNLEYSYFVCVHYNQRLWSRHINLIPKKILDDVRNEKCRLVFDNTLEGQSIKGDHFLNPFYDSIKKLKLSPSQIYFVTNNLIAEKTHKEWLEKNPDVEPVNIISYMYNVADVKRLITLHDLPSRVLVKNEIKYKEKNIENIKHFLKVNRTNRVERNLFMLFMNHHKLLDKSLISFPSFPKESYPSGFDEYTTNKNIEELRNKVPFDIDDTDKTNHGPAGFGKGKFNADLPFNPIHYRNSFISIVMCAFPLTEDSYHFHSSTFNPIYCGHPIVQYGPVNSLKILKEQGFKTFDKWWDESYDTEPNHWKRLYKVMKVVLELSKLSTSEMLSMYKEMEDTLKHNVDLIENYDLKTNLYDRIF